ncbi:hydantoinase B/oxoprolinase family protein [Bdellovibrio sp. 22V]|uniref:hydantoinase B/oxoprolinase family protein n=1 Tax=Bdellovibrio TaxID=958 RepID=UPI0025437EF9|nr:hydantoinase B/oxoprolinase family protein [Bdellovibrio sp. 22V]WII71242.1 hydantoinase B/oxoprolinase family protein [Bdellovibrio sp. 22V]
MSYQIELFHSLLNDFLDGESALLTLDGDVLGVRGSQAVSFGTLTTAASTASKYLKLQEGDIVLLNDPYSGGSILCDMTFVMAVSEDLLWVTRRSLGSSVKLAKSIEEEGLRIPPTPLRQKNQLNEMILSAMSAHPACPAHFVPWLKEQCADLTLKAKKLVEAIEYTGFTITAELIAEYLELSRQSATQKIGEKASGEARVDVVLDSGELLRLNLEIHDGRVSMDFSGTTSAKTVSLTESATYGACFHAISRFYGFTHFANTGSFSILQITKPTGCWLVGKYPAPSFKGMTCGVAALNTAIELALTQIHQKQEKALSSYCPLHFDLQHEGKNTFLTLPGGEGATSAHDGECAHVSSFSVEQLERNFPVKVQRVDLRQSAGGKGKFNGGRGVVLKMEVREPVQASWLTDLTLHRPRLPKNCSQGDACEVTMEHQGTHKNLPVLGQQNFVAGDVLTLCSGSGGGFGRAE